MELHPSSSFSSSAAAASASTSESDDPLYSAIRLEWEKAVSSLIATAESDGCPRYFFTELDREKMINDVEDRFIDHDDTELWLMFRRRTIESGKRATELSPNSIGCALFYANSLYDRAEEEGNGFEDVVRECERGLSIENPVDPMEENVFEDEDDSIENMKRELRVLIRKAKVKLMELGVIQCVRVRISDLFVHYLEDKRALQDAIFFYSINKSWRFWVCCYCSEMFVNAEDHERHVVKYHVREHYSAGPSRRSLSVLPSVVDERWAEMLLSCSWEPITADILVEILEKEKSKLSHSEDECSGEDRSTASGSEDKCNGEDQSEASDSEDEGCGLSLEEKEKMWVDIIPDYGKRARLLQKIGSMFQMLLEHKCLADSHLQKVIQLTRDKLRVLPGGCELFRHGIDENPLCICCLETSELTKIITFLQEICDACEVGEDSEKCRSEDECSESQISELEDIKIVVTVSEEDVAFLLLDEDLLPDDASGNNFSAAPWICADPSIGDPMLTWSRCRKEKADQGRKILYDLEKESDQLWDLCEEKWALCQRQCKKYEYLLGFQVLEKQSFLEVSRLEARILQKLSNTQRLYSKLGIVCMFDYCWMLLPLVNSYMLARGRDLAHEDASEKSSAEGSDNSGSLPEKTREKKQGEYSRGAMDSKATSVIEQLETSTSSETGADSEAREGVHSETGIDSGTGVNFEARKGGDYETGADCIVFDEVVKPGVIGRLMGFGRGALRVMGNQHIINRIIEWFLYVIVT